MRREYVSKTRDYVADFDSMDDLVKHVTSETAFPSHGRASRANYDYGRDWHGSRSFEEALSIIDKGWKEGEEMARKYAGRLFARIASQLQQPRYFYDVEGLDFDCARVIAGEPEPWIEQYHTEVEAPGQIIRVVYNISASSGVDPSVILTRGSVAAALVQLLEFAGKPVELIARWDTRSQWNGRFSITVKRAGQPLNMPEVAFALAHPSMLRRIMFAAMEHVDNDQVQMQMGCGGGYGMPDDTPEAARGDIYIGRMLYPETTWAQPATAEAWIIDQLKSFGVEVGQ